MPPLMEFDYIIIGAGSAGCVLANRLSANPNNRVLLLEAGGRDWHPFIHMPAGLAQLVHHKQLNWGYQTEPQSELHGRQLYWPRGRVLGGSSSINAMCYTRGHRKDYDHWAANGCPGWDYQSVLPFFRLSENQENGASPFHGAGGPLWVQNLRYTNPLSAVFLEASGQAGYAPNADFNGQKQQGFGYYQVTQRNGRRCSASVAYLRPIANRTNLTIRTGSLVQELLFEGSQISGVRYVRNGQEGRDRAGRIILSAGAINSPQLLMLSGVGPASELEKLGIPVRHALEGVGKNLQDHLDISTLVRSHRTTTYDKVNQLAVGLRYLLTRKGPGSSNIAEAGGFIASRYATDERPDIQMHFVPALLDDHGRNRIPGHGMTIHACALRPHSRGEIKLRSANPAEAPVVEPRYLTSEYDRKLMIECARLPRTIFGQAAFNSIAGEEIFPGAAQRSDAELLEFIRRKSETIYHPVGTCKMGSDELAVVDDKLQVRGLTGLAVVDASVMPTLVSGNTNAPTIMIAEKFAAGQ